MLIREFVFNVFLSMSIATTGNLLKRLFRAFAEVVLSSIKSPDTIRINIFNIITMISNVGIEVKRWI